MYINKSDLMGLQRGHSRENSGTPDGVWDPDAVDGWLRAKQMEHPGSFFTDSV